MASGLAAPRRIVVVGAGVMGSATAWALAGAGHQVTVVEQFRHAHDRGSSHGPSRIFRLGYPDPAYVRMAREAAHVWRQLEDVAGVELLTVTGGIDLGPPSELEPIAAAMAEAGQRYEWVEPADAAARWPGFKFSARILFHAAAGRLAADAALPAFQRQASAAGVEFRFGQRVARLRATGAGVEVVTERDTLAADVAVVSVGAWLAGNATRFAVDRLPPLRVTQEQPVYLASRIPDDGWPVFVDYEPAGVTARYGLMTPGVGLKVGEHGSGLEVDPDARPPVDDATVTRLAAYARERLPGAEPEAVRVDSCLYTTTPDESFWLRREGPIVVCSACSGHGFKFAPVVGQRVAELAVAQ